MIEDHIRWPGARVELVGFLGQNLRIGLDEVTGDPIGTLRIKHESFVGDGLALPNSTITSPVWTTIPGTNPVLEVRQDGHYPMDYIRVRMVNNFVNVTTVHANIILGSVPAATKIIGQGDEIRVRGFLQATGVVAASAVLANVATTTHRPLHNVSTGVRYTAGSSRFQILTNGDMTLGSALALNDQVWLDSVTYDLLA